MTAAYYVRPNGHRTNQGFNFLVGSSGNRDDVRAPIQFRREILPKYLKRLFFLK